MKKLISAILVCCLFVTAAFALISCDSGDIENGTYAYEVGGKEVMTIKISGSEMTMVSMYDENNGVETVMTYDLSDDKTELTVTFKEAKAIGTNATVLESVNQLNAQEDKEPETTEFEFTDNGFKFEGMEFVKK